MKFLYLASAFALLAEPFVVADLAYCATDNTGSSYKAVTDTYQSNGACQTTCAKYALGVLQGKKCWCTNVVPSESSQKSTSKCDTSCPGYPADSCGSAADGVFAYVSVGSKDPTSTEGSSGSSTSSTSSETTSGTSTSSTTSSHNTTTTSSTSSTTSTTGNIVKETTSAGQVKTITVAGSGPTAGADQSKATTSDDKSGLSGGSIAGIVIGVLGGLALLGGLIFMIFFYRKRARAASPIPSNADMADNRTSQGSSFMRGVFPQGSDGGNGLNRQNTYTDNRMKNVYPHGSRDSSVSLQDNEDYSRPVLRATNPD